jgi:hypothetical protein
MNMKPVALFAAPALGLAALALAQISIKPGLYEISTEVQMPGAPAPLKVTDNDCITPAEAANVFEDLRNKMGEAEDCKLGEPVISGNRVSWETECNEVKAKSELTFASDAFSGTVRGVAAGQTVDIKVSARWVAATCTDDDE